MSTAAPSLVVELLTEELPPRSLQRLAAAFGDGIASGLRERGLLADAAVVTTYATPRRLAVHVTQVSMQAADRTVEHKLMPVSVGLDAAGQATPALAKKLAALGAVGVTPSDLTRGGEAGKGQTLLWRTRVPGDTLAAGLQAALDATITGLPIPKVMTYQLSDGWSNVSFVRPVHGLVALHGSSVVPLQAFGLRSGDCTQGHRFEAAVNPVKIRHADRYAEQLAEQGGVTASFEQRRADIARQLDKAAAALQLTPIQDDALLDEVTALVERPNVLTCSFEPEYLAVPPECLILTMKANQKYFPLLDASGQLTHHFLVVSNVTPSDPSRIVEGNQRVVRPRLADAKFFFDKDRKTTLEARVAQLGSVVYHAHLGSLADRVARVRVVARTIAAQWGDAALARQADRAAWLAKGDLVTDMVGEFPELQGVMGGYYAQHDGEDEAVAWAVEDHYKPRFAGDSLPRQQVGTVVALADKLETLVGLFVAGERPSGDKDPFGLRRQALGILRLLIECQLPLALPTLVQLTAQTLMENVPARAAAAGVVQSDVLDFIDDRLAGMLREQGHGAAEVDAVLSLKPGTLADVPARLDAVRAFAMLPEAPALAAANKRVANILKKSDAGAASSVKESLLLEPAERELHAALQKTRPDADARFERGDFAASLTCWAALKAPVDTFFESVMVNTDDAALRNNRLALLSNLHAAMNRVADLSKLAV